jgi:hypothetical protein
MHLIIVVVSAACIEGTAVVVSGRNVCFIIGWVGSMFKICWPVMDVYSRLVDGSCLRVHFQRGKDKTQDTLKCRRDRCARASGELGIYLDVCRPFLSARVVGKSCRGKSCRGKSCRQDLSARLVGTRLVGNICPQDFSSTFIAPSAK